MAGGRLRTLLMIAVFDVGGPLLLYTRLRSAGLSLVAALLLSGVLPAFGVVIRAIWLRRLDAVGALVLAGIVAGSVLGLITHSARAVLVEGSVPTGVFGVVCLGSLVLPGRRPLMYRIALEFTGPDTAKGREMTALWQVDGFRRVFRVITAAWGTAFILEAGLRVVLVFSFSPGTVLAISKVTPFAFTGAMVAGTMAYGTYQRKKGERMGFDAASVLVSGDTVAGTPHGDDGQASGEHQAGAERTA